MKILLGQLPIYTVEKLVICSIELALYQAFVVIDGEERLVWETNERPLRRRNLMELREMFEGLDAAEVLLRQESAYDEMIGLPAESSSNRLEVGLGKSPYSMPEWLQ